MRHGFRLSIAIAMLVGGPAAFGGAHTWDVNEIFRNADGTVWFVELREANGTPGEIGTGGRIVASTASMFTIASNVVAPTTNRHLLFANPAFAALPGAPAPDQIVNIDSFFALTNDFVRYTPYDTLTFTNQLPQDGIHSLNRNLTTGVNSPTNYAGQSGSVDASGGSGSGAVAVTMDKTGAGEPRLLWSASCEAGDDGFGIYEGDLSTLSLGYSHASLVCSVAGNEHVPTPVFDASYFLVVPSGGSTEGSYGEGETGSRPQGGSPCATQEVSCTE